MIRLEDVTKDGFDWIWRVDNYQLLQKYLPDAAKPHESPTRKWYKKSNRYTGWDSTVAFRFYAIEPKVRRNKEYVIFYDFAINQIIYYCAIYIDLR